MKKIYNILMAAAIALGTFTSCEDVPMPFNNPLDYLEPDEGETVIEPAGDGTKDSPYNVAGVLAYIETLDPDVESPKDIYVTGTITSVKEAYTSQHGNATFVISDTDEGTNQFTFYRGLYFGNKKYSNDNDVNVEENDVVVVCGKVYNYQGRTPETVQNKAYIISINGKAVEPQKPTEIGSIDNPKTVTEALNAINALADNASTSEYYFVKGNITKIKTSSADIATFKNIDYIISDGTSEITVFRGKNIDNTDFTAAGQINVGDEVIVYGQLKKYVNNGYTTPEMDQGNYIVKYTKGTGSATGTPKGSGTLADPYNAAGANQFIKSLAADTESDKDVYIKGIIVKFANNGEFENSGTFGNSSFYISDDGKVSSEQFYVFRTLYFGNVKWTSGITPKVGDEVVICGKVVYYQGKTPETAVNKSYLYSLNGKTEGGGGGSDTPSSNLGTKDAPLTVAKALDAINALEDSGETETEAFVKGKISKVQSFNDKYKSITYYISDDGTETKELQIYSGKNIGGAEFASIDDLSVGDVVVVKGKLKKFMKNGEAIPEMNQPNEIISITKGSSGGEQGGGSEQGEQGSYTKPYSVASGIAAQGAEFKNIKDIYVKGYIVGWVEGQKLEEGAHFNANATVKSNILIADTANETDLSKCMPVQLPNNDVRSGMNLQDHPEFYGKAVILYGELAKYFGAAGVKSVIYAESDGKTLGTKP